MPNGHDKKYKSKRPRLSHFRVAMQITGANRKTAAKRAWSIVGAPVARPINATVSIIVTRGGGRRPTVVTPSCPSNPPYYDGVQIGNQCPKTNKRMRKCVFTQSSMHNGQSQKHGRKGIPKHGHKNVPIPIFSIERREIRAG